MKDNINTNDCALDFFGLSAKLKIFVLRNSFILVSGSVLHLHPGKMRWEKPWTGRYSAETEPTFRTEKMNDVSETDWRRTHHQQSKQNDPAAPYICFPSIIFLSLREKNSN